MQRHIQLLGGLSIVEDGDNSGLLRNAKGCALLTYLLVRGRAESREHLADILWESADTTSSLRNLRVLLTRAHPFLPGLHTTRRSLQYDVRPDEFVDYLTLSSELDQQDSVVHLSTLRLYRGDLLEGFVLDDAPRFMEWLTLERERIRRAVLDAHFRLCRALAEQKRWSEGVEASSHWLSIDNLNDEAVRWHLRFLAANGRPAAAAQAFKQFREALFEEFGVEPDPATEALANDLDEWSKNAHAISLPDLSPFDALGSSQLHEPGPLPANSVLPYHRNQNFVGRESALLEIATTLSRPSEGNRAPVAVLSGIGGLGKTQTAVEFCYRYGRYFPGGVFWLNFAEPENVPEEFAAIGSERGLGLFRENDKLTLSDRIGRVHRALQDSSLRLLVFDNCEDEELLSRWVPVTGGCRVLVTSRHGAWDSGLSMTTVPLNVLTADESIRLLRRLAPHVAEPDAGKIAREVGYLPLALHLAGGFLRRYRQISPTTYLAQIHDQGLLRHPSLQGHGVELSPTGHVLNVARTYALGWERLDANDEVDATARNMLVRAACLAPGEPIAVDFLTSSLVAGDDELTSTLLANDALSRLITMGFVTGDAAKSIVLHRVLAEFTRDSSDAQEYEKAHASLETSMTRLLEEYFNSDGHLSVLPISAVHVRHVSDAAFARATPAAATLGTLLGVHLTNISEFVQAEQVLQRACTAAVSTGNAHAMARALEVLARTQESMGHVRDALRSSQEAIALLRASERVDAAMLVDALYREGFAYYWLGQAEAALASAEEGYRISQSANLRPQMALCRSLAGVVNYYVLGEYRRGEDQLTEALSIYREAGRGESESSVLNNLGESARLQGNYSLASDYYERALTVARSIENQSKVDIIVSNLAGAQIGNGQFAQAADALEDLLARTRHDWFGLSESYRFLAEAYLGLGRTRQALTMARQALELADESNLFEHGRAWRVLGQIVARMSEPILVENGDDQLYDAASCFGQSLEHFASGKLERDRAITLWRWADYELGQGHQMIGNAMYEEAHALFTQLSLPLMVEQMEVTRARQARESEERFASKIPKG